MEAAKTMDDFVGSMLKQDEPVESEAPESDESEIEAQDAEIEDGADPETDDDNQDDGEAEPDSGDDSDEEADDEADTDSAADEQPESYVVKVDGVEQRVTLDELKRSYSGNAYIQKGMQEAAAARKQAEEVFNALQTERQQFLQFVQQVQQNGFAAAPKRPDPEMARTDPLGYVEAQAEYEAEMERFNEQNSKLRQSFESQQKVQQQAMQQYLQEQAAELQRRLPEASDPKKWAPLQAKIVAAGQDFYGFKPEELAQIADARHVQVLHDAMRYRELQKSTQTAKQAKKQIPAVKSKARLEVPEDVVRKRKLEAAKKSGKIEDLAALLLK